ncbi:hypothetical protein C8R43DRAFT_1141640 [Mycena crocata]|nr:hypothetical protein C8R43DRAFT_1141640 [Mycena crocata]
MRTSSMEASPSHLRIATGTQIPRSRTARYTEIDESSPCPPFSEFMYVAPSGTIRSTGSRDLGRHPNTCLSDVGWDNSWTPPPSDHKHNFMNDALEVAKGGFSRTFGPDLLPGMYKYPGGCRSQTASNSLRTKTMTHSRP